MVSFGGKPALPIVVSATATAAYAAGLLGNVIAFVLYLSPMCTFSTICYNGAVPVEMSVWTEMAALLNGLIWGMGGLPSVEPGNQLSMAVNGVGVLCLLFYIFIFFCYSGDRCFPFCIVFSLEVIIAAMFSSLLFTLPDTPKDRAQWVSFCGCITATATYGLPIWGIMDIICNRENAQRISLPKAAGALANAIVWVVYSTANGLQISVFVPNITGVVVGLIQLICYYQCQPNAPAEDIDQQNEA